MPLSILENLRSQQLIKMFKMYLQFKESIFAKSLNVGLLDFQNHLNLKNHQRQHCFHTWPRFALKMWIELVCFCCQIMKGSWGWDIHYHKSGRWIETENSVFALSRCEEDWVGAKAECSREGQLFHVQKTKKTDWNVTNEKLEYTVFECAALSIGSVSGSMQCSNIWCLWTPSGFFCFVRADHLFIKI